MEDNKTVPTRKKNRLQHYDYSSCGAYFITICTQKKQNYFWKNVGATNLAKSFHDHIICNQADYEEHINYIYYNPVRWHLDELYTEEGEAE